MNSWVIPFWPLSEIAPQCRNLLLQCRSKVLLVKGQNYPRALPYGSCGMALLHSIFGSVSWAPREPVLGNGEKHGKRGFQQTLDFLLISLYSPG